MVVNNELLALNFGNPDMRLIIRDKYKKQKVEILVNTHSENLIQGTILANSFDQELKDKIVEFEELANDLVLCELLDKAGKALDVYNWTVDTKDWLLYDFQVFNGKDISFRIKGYRDVDLNHL